MKIELTKVLWAVHGDDPLLTIRECPDWFERFFHKKKQRKIQLFKYKDKWYPLGFELDLDSKPYEYQSTIDLLVENAWNQGTGDYGCLEQGEVLPEFKQVMVKHPSFKIFASGNIQYPKGEDWKKWASLHGDYDPYESWKITSSGLILRPSEMSTSMLRSVENNVLDKGRRGSCPNLEVAEFFVLERVIPELRKRRKRRRQKIKVDSS